MPRTSGKSRRHRGCIRHRGASFQVLVHAGVDLLTGKDEMVNGWEGRPPAGDHVVVVSHRPKPESRHPEAFHNVVDGVPAAIAMAHELAGERTVAVNADVDGSPRGDPGQAGAAPEGQGLPLTRTGPGVRRPRPAF